MSLRIEVKRSFPIDPQNPKEGDPIMGEYVNLMEGEDGGIDLYQNDRIIAEVPNDKVEEVKEFQPRGAVIGGIKGIDQLIIDFLN